MIRENFTNKRKVLRHAVAKIYNWLKADGDDIRWINQRPLINQLLDGETGGRMLDCGCGSGMYQKKMRQRADQVWAMDIDTVNLKYCLREKLITNTAIRGDASSLPFASSIFDAVLCSEVIEHITNDSRAVGELSRVLKPGGRLIISVPVPPGNIDQDAFGHKREGYTLEALSKLLKENGLSVKKSETCFYSWSRMVLKVMAWHARCFKICPSRLVLIPVWLERFWGIKDKPYDMVLLAVKEVK